MRLHAVVPMILAISIASGGLACAAAPQARTQGPGFYRMMLGDFEVTALLDGTHRFPVATVLTAPSRGARPLLSEARPGEADALLAAEGLSAPVEGSINGFLVNTGARLMLIDAGAGALYGPCCGKLKANLEASGYRADQVDDVLLTHLHMDHVGGIAADGKTVFPNAVVHVSRADLDHWRSDAAKQAAPPFLKPFFDAAQAALRPYAETGRIRPFEGRTPLAAGVHALPAGGHTPGHSFFEIKSGGETLLVWGDVIHVASVQFPDPSITVKYDSEPGSAEGTRLDILADSVRQRHWIAAAHISFPGIGQIAVLDRAFVWRPANYTTELDPSSK